MQYRYRVEGKVEHSFILRGAFFGINNTINFYITESELDFVKERCKLDVIEDMQKPTKAENSVSNVAKPTENQKPVKRQYNKRSGA